MLSIETWKEVQVLDVLMYRMYRCVELDEELNVVVCSKLRKSIVDYQTDSDDSEILLMNLLPGFWVCRAVLAVKMNHLLLEVNLVCYMLCMSCDKFYCFAVTNVLPYTLIDAFVG